MSKTHNSSPFFDSISFSDFDVDNEPELALDNNGFLAERHYEDEPYYFTYYELGDDDEEEYEDDEEEEETEEEEFASETEEY